MQTVMYGCKLALVALEPCVLVVNEWLWSGMDSVAVVELPTPPAPCGRFGADPDNEKAPVAALYMPKSPVPLPPLVLPDAAPAELVVPVWLWLTSVASLLPPVSCNVSKAESPAFKPTITRPAPKAVQVPNPNNVAGFVVTPALM